MGAVERYFSMIRRETAIPGWMGNKEADVIHETDSSQDELSIGGVEGKAAATTVVRRPTSSDDEYEHGLDSAGAKQASGFGNIWWAVSATGAGLISDGIVNNGVGLVLTMLTTIYPKDVLQNSPAYSNIASLAFVGTVVGQLSFGWLADCWSRKAGMLISTGILIVLSILLSGAWGVGMPQHPGGMFAAISAYRTLIGVGIGGEYPAGSVACAEVAQKLKKGRRNAAFILFTNFMIDSGFVIISVVAWVLLYICDVPKYAEVGNSHGLGTAWRLVFGLSAIPPISLFFLRLKFKENEKFVHNNFKKAKTPWWLIVKRYWPRLLIVSLIWFIYDFLSYSWGIYSSIIVDSVVPTNAAGVSDIYKSFGWEIVFNLFYIPGSFLGAFASDYFGPRLTLFTGTFLESIVAFIMAGLYGNLKKHVGGLVVAYGIMITLGEFGPGDNIGLICSKTCATPIRGRYYGIAAAMGKIGAFVGTKVFPAIAKRYGGVDTADGQRVLLWVSASLCMFAAGLSLCIPELTQDTVTKEDAEFKKYLTAHGYDVSQMDSMPEDPIAIAEEIEPAKM